MSVRLIWKPALDIVNPAEHCTEGFSLEDIHNPRPSRCNEKWIELTSDRCELTGHYMISRYCISTKGFWERVSQKSDPTEITAD
jgi:hypothetical protein